MLYIKDIRDWFKQLNTNYGLDFENFYIGKLDNKKDKSLGFYNVDIDNYDETFCVGGLASFNIITISMLIHYNDSFNETEVASYNLYNKLKELMYSNEDIQINEHEVFCFYLLTANEDVGCDENGIYERVINFRIYYENK